MANESNLFNKFVYNCKLLAMNESNSDVDDDNNNRYNELLYILSKLGMLA